MCHGDSEAAVPQANFQENGRSDAAMFAGGTINCEANVHAIVATMLRRSSQNTMDLSLVPCIEIRMKSNACQNVSMHPGMPVSDIFLARIMEEASINDNICMKSWPAVCQGSDKDIIGIVAISHVQCS